jgi:transcriptional regulator with XRE-family HTH domain
MASRLNNYLRPHRRRIGLSQSEVAFLLGAHEGGRISRYEKGHRIPTLRTALAIATVFGDSPSNLFSGIQTGVDREVLPRIRQLRARLEKKHKEQRETPADNRKLHWLDEHWPATTNPDSKA